MSRSRSIRSSIWTRKLPLSGVIHNWLSRACFDRTAHWCCRAPTVSTSTTCSPPKRSSSTLQPKITRAKLFRRSFRNVCQRTVQSWLAATSSTRSQALRKSLSSLCHSNKFKSNLRQWWISHLRTQLRSLQHALKMCPTHPQHQANLRLSLESKLLQRKPYKFLIIWTSSRFQRPVTTPRPQHSPPRCPRARTFSQSLRANGRRCVKSTRKSIKFLVRSWNTSR